MSTYKYFAYGSNMSSKRLRSRTPSARVLGVVCLDGHRLAFHKISTKDGSGKCDIVADKSSRVFGVLYEIEKGEKPKLDRLEGLGYGYAEKIVNIELQSGTTEQATTYVATNINSKLKPFAWYKRHVIEGAKEANLPQQYIKCIESVAADVDPDKPREKSELAIYG